MVFKTSYKQISQTVTGLNRGGQERPYKGEITKPQPENETASLGGSKRRALLAGRSARAMTGGVSETLLCLSDARRGQNKAGGGSEPQVGFGFAPKALRSHGGSRRFESEKCLNSVRDIWTPRCQHFLS